MKTFKEKSSLSVIILVLLSLFVGLFGLFSGCKSNASIASENLSVASDNFQVNRRVVFYNGITDKYILMIEGKCSVDFYSDKFTVTVKTGPNSFKKHYLGKADNVFPFVEQIEPSAVSEYHSKVIFKPLSIIPDIDIKR